MDKMPFYLVFLQALPESAILVALGLILIGVKPRLLPLFLVALINALASYYIRALPIAPGVNMLLQLPLLIVLIASIIQVPFTFAMLATFLGLICVALAEIVFNSIIPMVTGISLMEALANPLWRILFPLPEFMFLFIVILVLIRYEKSIFNLLEFNETEQVKKYEER